MNTIRIATVGQGGRMNQAIRACLSKHASLELIGDLRIGNPFNDLCELLRSVDVVVDFSKHALTPCVLELCRLTATGLVLGTTGHSEPVIEVIKESARKVPVVWAPNFSTGVTLLLSLVAKAAVVLGPDCDVEVVEMHHRLKRDAPSGTALALARVVERIHGRTDADLRHGRRGEGLRSSTEIGIHALRGGSVVGDHTVIFANDGERVELTHKAASRETFADGALRAAQWIAGKPSGLYDMQDVLGLRS